MICPNCHRVISDNEICTCKLEAVKKKNEELKKERKEAARLAAEEEKAKQDELNKRKQEAAEKAANIKNNVADLSSNVVSDFMEFIESPDYGSLAFVRRKNKVAVIILLVSKLILTLFLSFSLLRSSISNVLNMNGGDMGTAFTNGLIIFATSIIIDIIAVFIRTRDTDIFKLLSYVSAKGVLQVPVLLISVIATAMSGSIGLGIIGGCLVIGGIIDFLTDEERSTKTAILTFIAYTIKIAMFTNILFNF